MKKPIKIILLVLAVITVIAVIIAVVMLKAVSGDNLFYMDSTFGSIYAANYRWVCLASGILMLFWIMLVVKKQKEIRAKLLKLKCAKKKIADNVLPTAPTLVAESVPTVFCTKCGKQRPAKSKFCPFCGQPVVSSSNGKEAEL